MNNMITVKFPNLGKHIEIEDGAKITEACAMVGEPLNQVCGGKGKCGKCAVDIKRDGNLETVIGCQTKVFDGLEIMITGQETTAQILTSNMIKDIQHNPSLRIVHVKKEELKTPLGENDWETLSRVLKINLCKPTLDILKKLSNTFHDPEGINIILYDNTILNITSGDKDTKLYGLAFDVGSTSVVGYLYDMNTYKQIGISSMLNKQTSIGGDVISRIEYTINNTNGLKRLNDLVIETINEIIEDICKKHDIDKNDIYQGTFCGNSTMQHLFLGLNPAHLGLAPFSSTTHDIVYTTGKDARVKINPLGMVTFFPLLGGHVGGDTSAVILSVQNDDKYRLIIDLGTNGEVAVGKNYTFKVSSMASGPALEGYGLEFGMRGTIGAIERVSILNGDLYYKVIGKVKPRGICGSGIIDLLADLLRYNLINTKGVFAKPSEVDSPNLARRLITVDNAKVFVIAHENETENGKAILLTQKDIRQIQLAIAAIYTGCNMLIAESGLKGEELEEILMAGAFGNYIDIEKAQYIGMIPYFKGVPVYSIGNAAATGSQLFLLSKEDKEECEKIAENAIHVEIATNPNFTDNFIQNVYLNKVERY
ncbi:MAG: ASKHA domain-containing protein [Eubacteriaceae bacterium]